MKTMMDTIKVTTGNSVLVNLNIRTWQANVMDQGVTKDVATQHGTDKRYARVWKTLMPKGKGTALGEIYAIEREARNFHYGNTLPWMHDGPRILTTDNYHVYMKKMRNFRAELEKKVTEFLNEYELAKAHAKDDLKTLYKEDDYPDRKDLAKRFGIDVNVMPLPKTDTLSESGLPPMEVERIKRELEQDMALTFQRANEDLWNRLYSSVNNLQTRLKGDPKYLRESVLNNSNDFLDLLARMNVNNDATLEDLRVKLKKQFQGLDAEALRNDESLRSQKANEVDAIESMMASFMGGRPTKQGQAGDKMGLKHAA